MDKVDAVEQVKGPVAPPEPISPARSAIAATTSAGAAASSATASTASASATSAPAPASASLPVPAPDPAAAAASVSAPPSASVPPAVAASVTPGRTPVPSAPTSAAGAAPVVPAKLPSPAPTPAPGPAPTAAAASASSDHRGPVSRASPALVNPRPAPTVAGPPSPARDAPELSQPANNNTVVKTATATESSAPLQAAKQSVLPPHKDAAPPNQTNGGTLKNGFEDGDPESELSDPDSTLHSPPPVAFAEPEEEIIVRSRLNGAKKASPRAPTEPKDQTMADVPDEPVVSHYPKRKRTSLYHDLSESKIDSSPKLDDRKEASSTPVSKGKPPRQSLSSVKGVIVGYWRDSPAPDINLKHAVIGFIDVRDRLRTRIQPITTSNDPVPASYPLPPGPGGSWVTFERIVFSDHLVGLDHYQVKEYVRLRSDAFEETEPARKAAEREAVKEAIRRAKQNQLDDPSPLNNPPTIAYGLEIPDGANIAGRPEVKRRRVSGGFSAITPAPVNGVPAEHILPSQNSPAITRGIIDSLPGSRPTRILLGYWKPSNEKNPADRHAVYGILGQNDMFRVKLVRETRDGRFVDGNFPVGAGALWIAYEEVEFDQHLKPLTRLEIKEYCRVRQWQIDQGESPEERITNETKAVYEAQARVGAGLKALSPTNTSFGAPSTREDVEMSDSADARNGVNPPELRQSRRVEARQERPIRQAPPPPPPVAEPEPPRPASRVQNNDALERTSTLARREIARAEAAQGRADRHAANRERAAAAAADATAAAMAAAMPAAAATNGRMRFHESEEMQRLNKVWARQESLRMKAGAEDAKIYGGIKYERKGNGPFMGKLVSQGTIISIDGEDFVEYRVLTKPSFF